jgi:hypothetical protein
MNYKAAPTVKSTPNRRTRKSDRNKAFIYNRSLRAKINREKRAMRVTATEER